MRKQWGDTKMRLKIQSKNVILTIAVTDAVCFKDEDKAILFDLSGKNFDTYRFTHDIASTKDVKETNRFVDACEQIIDVLHQGKGTYECSFEEFEGIKFEKFSPCGHID
jgi:hypothetical protein